MKQLHPELFLQVLDPLRKRRLSHVQTLRGATEMQLLGEHHKVLEMVKVHRGTISVWYQAE